MKINIYIQKNEYYIGIHNNQEFNIRYDLQRWNSIFFLIQNNIFYQILTRITNHIVNAKSIIDVIKNKLSIQECNHAGIFFVIPREK